MKVRLFAIRFLTLILLFTGEHVTALAQEQQKSTPITIWVQAGNDASCFRCATNSVPCNLESTKVECSHQTFKCLTWDERTQCPIVDNSKASKSALESKRAVSHIVATGSSPKAKLDFVLTDQTKMVSNVSSKSSTCHRCLEWSGLVCVKENEKGECIQWKYSCLQWEDYPC